MIELISNTTEVFDRVKESLYTDEAELEVLVNNRKKINRDTFIGLLNLFKSKKYRKINIPEMLDIRTLFKTQSDKSIFSNTRATLLGVGPIKKYCETDNIELVERYLLPEGSNKKNILYIQKSNYFKKDKKGEKVFFNTIINEEYNYKINLKREVNSNQYNIENFKDVWNDKLKMFRYKKRFSFETRDKLFRIDLTIVKENSKEKNGQYILTNTFKEANILNNPENYEVEIEYIGSQANTKNIAFINIYANMIVEDKLIDFKDILKLKTFNNLYKIDSNLEKVEFGEIHSVKGDFTKSKNVIIRNKLNDKQEKELVLLVIELLNHHIYSVLQIINNSHILLSSEKKTEIINEYRELTDEQQSNKRITLITPQPVTLTLENLSDTFATCSILENYSVTEKADGDRFLLFINKEGDSYLLNLTGVTRFNSYTYMNVIPCDVKFKNIRSTILDGEFVTRNINGEKIKLYLYFDIYINGSVRENIFNMPFISDKTENSREYYLEEFEKEYLENSKHNKESITLHKKTYYHGNKKMDNIILRHSDRILKRSDESGYDYKIDGLIFLPSNLSIKAESPGEKVININGTWPLNFKWKPVEENTIDFKVEIKQDGNNRDKIIYYIDDVTNEVNKYKQVFLKVGYNENDDDSVEYYLKTLSGMKKNDRNIKREIYFSPSETDIMDIHITNIKLKSGRAYCNRDNLEIQNGDIVEFKYVANGNNNCKWIPLRKRPDKQNPQYYKIADSIWDTICNPVNEDMIRNRVSLEKLRPSITKYIEDKELKGELHSNIYYIGRDREYSTSKPLLDYHNYVKTQLISCVCKMDTKTINYMDTSSGRGGDLGKWLSPDYNIGFLLGLDISRDLREASKRLYNSRQYNNKDWNKEIVFAMSDTSKNILSGESLQIESEGNRSPPPELIYSKIILDILYNRNLKDIPESYSSIKKRLAGKALEKFDVISNQFSIHYYFKDVETLIGYILNLTDNIKPGGYFIGTCYSGERVYESLEQNDGEIEYIDDMGNRVYSIKRDYDKITNDFDIPDDDMELNWDNIGEYLGHKIKVYMETIGQEIDEYLVNFKLFNKIMNYYEFELVSPNDIDNVLNKEGTGSFEEVFNNFKKSGNIGKYSQAYELDENKDLSRLSYLNNWFCFKYIGLDK